MRDRFSELIKQGVASFQEKPVGPDVPTLDPLVRLYNGLWGLLTDTHMSKVDDEYIITGTFTQSPYWDSFKYSAFWGTTNFKLGSGYNSLDHMLCSYGYKLEPDIYNSDKIMKLVALTEEDMAKKCCTECPCDCVYAESKIPHPVTELFDKMQLLEFNSLWRSGEGNAYKVVENLKHAKTFDGSTFRVTSDEKYIVSDGQKLIMFEL